MLDFILTALTFVVPFVLVLGLVVTIHELGHFLAAKMFGVAIDRFSIGFGKGGYVRFTGDENAASVPDAEDLNAMREQIARREGQEAVARYFHFKPLWQRAVIAAAGPIANFVLAVALFASLLLALGQYVLPAKIASVQPGSPAEAAGFRTGDLIVEANGRRIKSFDELAVIVQVRAEVPTSGRGGRSRSTPRRAGSSAPIRSLGPTGRACWA